VYIFRERRKYNEILPSLGAAQYKYLRVKAFNLAAPVEELN
jgi:hypothetical protein